MQTLHGGPLIIQLRGLELAMVCQVEYNYALRYLIQKLQSYEPLEHWLWSQESLKIRCQFIDASTRHVKCISRACDSVRKSILRFNLFIASELPRFFSLCWNWESVRIESSPHWSTCKSTPCKIVSIRHCPRPWIIWAADPSMQEPIGVTSAARAICCETISKYVLNNGACNSGLA